MIKDLPRGVTKLSNESWAFICDCMDVKDYFGLIFENDKGIKTISFFKDLYYDEYWFLNKGWKVSLKKYWKRLKASLRILFKGRLDLEGDFIFMGDDQIESLIKILKEFKVLKGENK